MRLLRLGLVFLLAVLAHVRSLTYWFASTDTLALIETSRVSSPAGVVRVLTTPMLSGSRFTGFALFYRPVSSLSYALDYALWGLWPAGYHLTNVLLHGVVVVLVALAVEAVTDRPVVGIVAAGLVALHPLTAELVPSIARRQDVIMTTFLLASLVFLVRGWRNESRPLLVGSIAAYVLALGSKEPALVFPGVVATWVALDGSDGSIWERIRASVVATVPFAVVTGAYLAVRIAILGGIGGYDRGGTVTPPDGVVLVAKYVLSLTYPSDVIGVWLVPSGHPLASVGWPVPSAGWPFASIDGPLAAAGWLLVVAVVAGLVPVLLRWRAGRSAGSHSAESHSAGGPANGGPANGGPTNGGPANAGRRYRDDLPFVVAVACFGAVPVLIAFGTRLEGAIPLLLGYDRPVSALVGTAYVGGCLVAAFGAARIGSTFSSADRTSLAFFAVWLALPLVLFVRAGGYTIRAGYLSLVPAMAALALCLVVGGRALADDIEIDFDGVRPVRWTLSDASATNVALVGALVLLVGPLLVTTPLIHSYDGWGMSGEVNRVTLHAVQNELNEAQFDPDRPGGRRQSGAGAVRIDGFPSHVVAQQNQFPRVKSTAYLAPGTVEAWLRLQGMGDVTVIVENSHALPRAPTGARTSSTVEGTTLSVHIEYVYGSTAR